MSYTIQPYDPGTTWRFHNVGHPGNVRESELVYLWEADGSSITDDYLPEEVSAHDLWRRWVDRYADQDHKQWPELFQPGEIRISWFITTPEQRHTFEGAPHASKPPTDYQYDEDFLTHYSHPVDVATGERLNWLRLPVLDRGWTGRGDKAGFVQEVLGWKPAPLQDRLNVRQLGRAAGVYVP